MRSLNTEQIIKNAFKMIDMNDIGHGWMHSTMTAKQLNARMAIEHKSIASGFTISQMELHEKMKKCLELNAKNIEKWLIEGGSAKKAFKLSCKSPIGLLMSKKDWCNRETGESCSRLVVVLGRYFDDQNGVYNFKIITEYSEFTKDEELKIKERY